MKNLQEIAELAHLILHKQTKYHTNKKIIKKVFNLTSENYSKKSIILRLSIIDSFYSTQMNKRYFGIEDIACKIYNISNNNENIITDKFIKFAENPNSIENKDIENLFSNKNKYGIHKNGDNAGQAPSLISKYAYYQTEFNFPIYDKLGKFAFPMITKKYYPDKKMAIQTTNIKKYIKSINELKTYSKIDNYDKLDNLLWLTGKILKGNFHLIYNDRKTYKTFTNKIIEHCKNDKSDFSQNIIECLENNRNTLNNIIVDNNLRKFIEFALQIKHYK